MIQKIKNKVLTFVNDPKFKEILFGSFYTTIAKIVAMLLGIITSIIGARYYGPEMVGFSMIISSILGIGAILSTFGLSTAMLQLVPDSIVKSNNNDAGWAVYKKVLYLMLSISFLTSVIYYFSANLIANTVFHKPELAFFLALSAFVLVFRAVYDLNSAKIRLLGEMKVYAFFQLLPKITSLLLLLLLTSLFYNPYNLIYIVFSAPVLMTIASSWYLLRYKQKNHLNQYIQKASLPKNKTILSVAFPMLISTGMFLVIAQTDIIMLGMYRSTKEVGVYSIVLALLLLITFVISSIEMIAGPKFAKLFSEKKMDELEYVAKKSAKLSFFISLPLILILMLLGKWVLSIYGEAFTGGYLPLLILLAGQIVSAMVGPAGYMLDMTGYQKQFRNIVLLAGGVNIVMNYILIPYYGIEGAALASLISVIIWKMGTAFYIKKIFGFHILYIPFLTHKRN
ncbi:MAG: flippase [Sulfurovum sp.]|nr:flippase [Sulfurovum sp.]